MISSYSMTSWRTSWRNWYQGMTSSLMSYSVLFDSSQEWSGTMYIDVFFFISHFSIIELRYFSYIIFWLTLSLTNCFQIFLSNALFFPKQVFPVQPSLSWNSLCIPGWLWTQNSACLCLLSAGIKGVHHHCSASCNFFKSITFLSFSCYRANI